MQLNRGYESRFDEIIASHIASVFVTCSDLLQSFKSPGNNGMMLIEQLNPHCATNWINFACLFYIY